MNLTPSTIRLDLKCGKGAISEGEKCHKGPASEVQRENNPRERARRIAGNVAKGAAIGIVAGITIQNIQASRNQRAAFAEKFGDASKYKEYTGEYGNVTQVRKGFKPDKDFKPKSGSFGSVVFGKYNNESVVIKSPVEQNPTIEKILQEKVKNGELSQKTYDAMQAASGRITEGEVFAARKAAELGFGPKVYAADSDTLILGLAKGRELSRSHILLRMYGDPTDLAIGIQENPAKVIGATIRSSTKYKELSVSHKAKVLGSLAKMHSAGIAHNDLHLKNVFMSSKGAEFIDFGLAETGGAAVSAEFVRLMNPPRTGLHYTSGFGYNLKSLDPDGYKTTEAALKQIIGKKHGSLTSNDIRRAVEAAGADSGKMEEQLQQAVDSFYMRFAQRSSRTDSLRRDAAGKRCGQGYIAAGKQCQQKGSFPTRKAIAAGLGVAAVGAGAYALHRHRTRIEPARVSFAMPAQVQPGAPRPALPGDRTTRRLTGTTPKGLLPPSPPRQGKTARMRKNTGAAIGEAERRIAQTAREEVRRIAQIGNTMAAAGEASGMAAKTGWREVRLRVEAARRRYEPGYRRGRRFQSPPLLRGGSGAPVQLGLTPRTISPQRARIRRSDALPGKSPAW